MNLLVLIAHLDSDRGDTGCSSRANGEGEEREEEMKLTKMMSAASEVDEHPLDSELAIRDCRAIVGARLAGVVRLKQTTK